MPHNTKLAFTSFKKLSEEEKLIQMVFKGYIGILITAQ